MVTHRHRVQKLIMTEPYTHSPYILMTWFVMKHGNKFALTFTEYSISFAPYFFSVKNDQKQVKFGARYFLHFPTFDNAVSVPFNRCNECNQYIKWRFIAMRVTKGWHRVLKDWGVNSRNIQKRPKNGTVDRSTVERWTNREREQSPGSQPT
jgi:hypothetical protein